MAPWQVEVGRAQDEGMLAVANRIPAMRNGAQMETFVFKTIGVGRSKSRQEMRGTRLPQPGYRVWPRPWETRESIIEDQRGTKREGRRDVKR